MADSLYKSILHNLSGCFWIVDETGNILDVNDSYCLLTGYTRDELTTLKVNEIQVLDPNLPCGVPCVLSTPQGWMDKNIQEVHFETRHRCKDGARVDIAAHAKYLKDFSLFYVTLHELSGGIAAQGGISNCESEPRCLAQKNKTIADIGRIISSTVRIEDVYHAFAVEVGKLIPFNRIAISLLNGEKNSVTVSYVCGVEVEGRRPGDLSPLQGSVTAWMVQSRAGKIINYSEEEMNQFQRLKWGYDAGLRSGLSLPLLYGDQVIGGLHLRSREPGAYCNSDLVLGEQIAAQIAGAVTNARLLAGRQEAIKTLKVRERELSKKSRELKEVNAALKGLLSQREKDKIDLEEKILLNIKELVLPYIEKLKKRGKLTGPPSTFVEIIEHNLNEIISPFVQDLKAKFLHLTPREIQVAHLVKSGKTTREIAEILDLSARTVDFYRDHIRKKLGLKNKNANLISYLSSL